VQGSVTVACVLGKLSYQRGRARLPQVQHRPRDGSRSVDGVVRSRSQERILHHRHRGRWRPVKPF